MDSPGSLNFNQVLQRLQTDDCTTYVVTRPPDQDWHRDALNALRDTGCTSIVLNPALHAKIYVAETASHNCGLLGSANFTARSIKNAEVGVIVEGKTIASRSLLSELRRLAQDLYAGSRRNSYCRRRLGGRR